METLMEPPQTADTPLPFADVTFDDVTFEDGSTAVKEITATHQTLIFPDGPTLRSPINLLEDTDANVKT